MHNDDKNTDEPKEWENDQGPETQGRSGLSKGPVVALRVVVRVWGMILMIRIRRGRSVRVLSQVLGFVS